MNLWQRLGRWTDARIGLGQAGSALPTKAHLAVQEAQALARDALWQRWEPESLSQSLAAESWATVTVATEVSDRKTFLARPDLGRQLSRESQAALSQLKKENGRLAICVSDGLSATAIAQHAQAFLSLLLPRLAAESLYGGHVYPIILMPYARVAAADAVGEALGAELSIILIGERPGLSAHDSLGIYLTHKPRIGLSDSERNCISNVRPPSGLSYELACEQLSYLVRESLRLKLSGVELKMQNLSLSGPPSRDNSVSAGSFLQK